MHAKPLTEETAADILKTLGKPIEGVPLCCASVLSFKSPTWLAQWQPCYRPVTQELDNHPDHFGIPFFGAYQKGPTPEAEAFLSALMAPDGAFKDVLPHLYHATAKEVWVDKGFVVKDALAMKSPGVLWTFLLSARMIWEHSFVLPIFIEASALTKDPQVALFASLALVKSPRKNIYSDARGGMHGEALGTNYGNAIRLRKAFLQGVVVPGNTTHNPYASWQCFPTDEPSQGYGFVATKKPLSDWITEFEAIRAQHSS